MQPDRRFSDASSAVFRSESLTNVHAGIITRLSRGGGGEKSVTRARDAPPRGTRTAIVHGNFHDPEFLVGHVSHDRNDRPTVMNVALPVVPAGQKLPYYFPRKFRDLNAA